MADFLKFGEGLSDFTIFGVLGNEAEGDEADWEFGFAAGGGF
jgi:hypothetical protein